MPGDHDYGVSENELIEIIRKTVTAKAISALLDEAYGGLPDTEAPMPKGTKAEEFLASLRDGVNRGFIPRELVYNLVRDAEENGSQHIFYYRLTNPENRAVYSNMSYIGTRLWGEGWEQAMGFPKFTLLPQNMVPGDLRRPSHSQTITNDWILRLYDVLMRLKEQVEEQEQLEDGGVKKIFRPHREKGVLVVRWHAFGVLELRVPSGQSKKVMESAKAKLWALLERAMDPADFQEWELSPALSKLYQERNVNKDKYELGSLGTMAADGTLIDIRPSDEEDSLADSEIAEKKIADAEQNLEVCRKLGIIFKKGDATGFSHKLRVSAGLNAKNEAIILGSATPSMVDYVTYRFRAFSK
jgi:hypothetical protein